MKRWRAWIVGLVHLRHLKISRCYKPKCDNKIQMQLHLFSDASNVARGTVCYLRVVFPNSAAKCSLVMAKTRVSGAGRTTIPRAELEAALDAVKLSRTIKQELDIPDCPVFFWTDSFIVLHSLHANCKRFSLFPRNRLQRILTHSKVYDWGYVSSKANPADKITRGLTAKILVRDELWFNGPPFLQLPPNQWPTGFSIKPISNEIYKQYDLQSATTMLTAFRRDPLVTQVSSCLSEESDHSILTESTPTDLLISYHSTLYRLKLATAWLIRFKEYLLAKATVKSVPSTGQITVQEMQSAEMNLIKYIQRQRFPEISVLKNGKSLKKGSSLYKLDPILVYNILRVGGRLTNADLAFDLKHPIILPESCHLTSLIIYEIHSTVVGHCGVNSTLNRLCQRFWIINARVTVRRIISECAVCRRVKSKPSNQFMADLPPARLKVYDPPFSHVGVDYFGPFLTKMKRSEVKRYGCLFTCMTTRAIHLEMAQDLAMSSFINALRRFVAGRGPVKHVYSDNGTNLVGAAHLLRASIESWNQSQMHKSLRQMKTDWTFNSPYASHTGGVWERMIRLVRQILLAVTPTQTLRDDDLATLFAEVEAIVNSRPLTDVPLEVGEPTPLSPNHLLRVNAAVAKPFMLTDESDNYARQRFRIVQYAADQFWQRWLLDYPKTIQTRGKWHKTR